MTIFLIALLYTIYRFARKEIKTGPLKDVIDDFFNKANKKLEVFKDEKPKRVLLSISRYSQKVFFVLIAILIFVYLVLRIKLPTGFTTQFFGPALVISLLFSFSVSWVQKHKTTVKDVLFSYPFLVFVLAPLVIFVFRESFPEKILLNPLTSVIEEQGLFKVQVVWSICLFLFFYIYLTILGSFIYLSLYVLVLAMAFMIKKVGKYINSDLLDGIITTGFFLISIFSLVEKI